MGRQRAPRQQKETFGAAESPKAVEDTEHRAPCARANENQKRFFPTRNPDTLTPEIKSPDFKSAGFSPDKPRNLTPGIKAPKNKSAWFILTINPKT